MELNGKINILATDKGVSGKNQPSFRIEPI